MPAPGNDDGHLALILKRGKPTHKPKPRHVPWRPAGALLIPADDAADDQEPPVPLKVYLPPRQTSSRPRSISPGSRANNRRSTGQQAPAGQVKHAAGASKARCTTAPRARPTSPAAQQGANRAGPAQAPHPAQGPANRFCSVSPSKRRYAAHTAAMVPTVPLMSGRHAPATRVPVNESILGATGPAAPAASQAHQTAAQQQQKHTVQEFPVLPPGQLQGPAQQHGAAAGPQARPNPASAAPQTQPQRAPPTAKPLARKAGVDKAGKGIGKVPPPAPAARGVRAKPQGYAQRLLHRHGQPNPLPPRAAPGPRAPPPQIPSAGSCTGAPFPPPHSASAQPQRGHHARVDKSAAQHHTGLTYDQPTAHTQEPYLGPLHYPATHWQAPALPTQGEAGADWVEGGGSNGHWVGSAAVYRDTDAVDAMQGPASGVVAGHHHVAQPSLPSLPEQRELGSVGAGVSGGVPAAGMPVEVGPLLRTPGSHGSRSRVCVAARSATKTDKPQDKTAVRNVASLTGASPVFQALSVSPLTLKAQAQQHGDAYNGAADNLAAFSPAVQRPGIVPAGAPRAPGTATKTRARTPAHAKAAPHSAPRPARPLADRTNEVGTPLPGSTRSRPLYTLGPMQGQEYAPGSAGPGARGAYDGVSPRSPTAAVPAPMTYAPRAQSSDGAYPSSGRPPRARSGPGAAASPAMPSPAAGGAFARAAAAAQNAGTPASALWSVMGWSEHTSPAASVSQSAASICWNSPRLPHAATAPHVGRLVAERGMSPRDLQAEGGLTLMSQAGSPVLPQHQIWAGPTDRALTPNRLRFSISPVALRMAPVTLQLRAVRPLLVSSNGAHSASGAAGADGVAGRPADWQDVHDTRSSAAISVFSTGGPPSVASPAHSVDQADASDNRRGRVSSVEPDIAVGSSIHMALLPTAAARGSKAAGRAARPGPLGQLIDAAIEARVDSQPAPAAAAAVVAAQQPAAAASAAPAAAARSGAEGILQAAQQALQGSIPQRSVPLHSPINVPKGLVARRLEGLLQGTAAGQPRGSVAEPGKLRPHDVPQDAHAASIAPQAASQQPHAALSKPSSERLPAYARASQTSDRVSPSNSAAPSFGAHSAQQSQSAAASPSAGDKGEGSCEDEAVSSVPQPDGHQAGVSAAEEAWDEAAPADAAYDLLDLAASDGDSAARDETCWLTPRLLRGKHAADLSDMESPDGSPAASPPRAMPSLDSRGHSPVDSQAGSSGATDHAAVHASDELHAATTSTVPAHDEDSAQEQGEPGVWRMPAEWLGGEHGQGRRGVGRAGGAGEPSPGSTLWMTRRQHRRATTEDNDVTAESDQGVATELPSETSERPDQHSSGSQTQSGVAASTNKAQPSPSPNKRRAWLPAKKLSLVPLPLHKLPKPDQTAQPASGDAAAASGDALAISSAAAASPVVSARGTGQGRTPALLHEWTPVPSPRQLQAEDDTPTLSPLPSASAAPATNTDFASTRPTYPTDAAGTAAGAAGEPVGAAAAGADVDQYDALVHRWSQLTSLQQQEHVKNVQYYKTRESPILSPKHAATRVSLGDAAVLGAARQLSWQAPISEKEEGSGVGSPSAAYLTAQEDRSGSAEASVDQDKAEASAGADDSSSVHEQRSPEDYLIECVALCTSDSEGERDADTTVRSSLSETLPAQLVGPASDVGDAGQSGAQQGESQADEAAAASDAAADVSEHPVEQPAADPAAAQAPAAAVTRPAAAATAAAAVETGPLSELIQSCEEMSAMVADEEQILQSITFLTPVQPQARRGAPAKKKADGTGPVTGPSQQQPKLPEHIVTAAQQALKQPDTAHTKDKAPLQSAATTDAAVGIIMLAPVQPASRAPSVKPKRAASDKLPASTAVAKPFQLPPPIPQATPANQPIPVATAAAAPQAAMAGGSGGKAPFRPSPLFKSPMGRALRVPVAAAAGTAGQDATVTPASEAGAVQPSPAEVSLGAGMNSRVSASPAVSFSFSLPGTRTQVQAATASADESADAADFSFGAAAKRAAKTRAAHPAEVDGSGSEGSITVFGSQPPAATASEATADASAQGAASGCGMGEQSGEKSPEGSQGSSHCQVDSPALFGRVPAQAGVRPDEGDLAASSPSFALGLPASLGSSALACSPSFAAGLPATAGSTIPASSPSFAAGLAAAGRPAAASSPSFAAAFPAAGGSITGSSPSFAVGLPAGTPATASAAPSFRFAAGSTQHSPFWPPSVLAWDEVSMYTCLESEADSESSSENGVGEQDVAGNSSGTGEAMGSSDGRHVPGSSDVSSGQTSTRTQDSQVMCRTPSPCNTDGSDCVVLGSPTPLAEQHVTGTTASDADSPTVITAAAGVLPQAAKPTIVIDTITAERQSPTLQPTLAEADSPTFGVTMQRVGQAVSDGVVGSLSFMPYAGDKDGGPTPGFPHASQPGTGHTAASPVLCASLAGGFASEGQAQSPSFGNVAASAASPSFAGLAGKPAARSDGVGDAASVPAAAFGAQSAVASPSFAQPPTDDSSPSLRGFKPTADPSSPTLFSKAPAVSRGVSEQASFAFAANALTAKSPASVARPFAGLQMQQSSVSVSFAFAAPAGATSPSVTAQLAALRAADTHSPTFMQSNVSAPQPSSSFSTSMFDDKENAPSQPGHEHAGQATPTSKPLLSEKPVNLLGVTSVVASAAANNATKDAGPAKPASGPRLPAWPPQPESARDEASFALRPAAENKQQQTAAGPGKIGVQWPPARTDTQGAQSKAKEGSTEPTLQAVQFLQPVLPQPPRVAAAAARKPRAQRVSTGPVLVLPALPQAAPRQEAQAIPMGSGDKGGDLPSRSESADVTAGGAAGPMVMPSWVAALQPGGAADEPPQDGMVRFAAPVQPTGRGGRAQRHNRAQPSPARQLKAAANQQNPTTGPQHPQQLAKQAPVNRYEGVPGIAQPSEVAPAPQLQPVAAASKPADAPQKAQPDAAQPAVTLQPEQPAQPQLQPQARPQQPWLTQSAFQTVVKGAARPQAVAAGGPEAGTSGGGFTFHAPGARHANPTPNTVASSCYSSATPDLFTTRNAPRPQQPAAQGHDEVVTADVTVGKAQPVGPGVPGTADSVQASVCRPQRPHAAVLDSTRVPQLLHEAAAAAAAAPRQAAPQQGESEAGSDAGPSVGVGKVETGGGDKAGDGADKAQDHVWEQYARALQHMARQEKATTQHMEHISEEASSELPSASAASSTPLVSALSASHADRSGRSASHLPSFGDRCAAAGGGGGSGPTGGAGSHAQPRRAASFSGVFLGFDLPACVERRLESEFESVVLVASDGEEPEDDGQWPTNTADAECEEANATTQPHVPHPAALDTPSLHRTQTPDASHITDYRAHSQEDGESSLGSSTDSWEQVTSPGSEYAGSEGSLMDGLVPRYAQGGAAAAAAALASRQAQHTAEGSGGKEEGAGGVGGGGAGVRSVPEVGVRGFDQLLSLAETLLAQGGLLDAIAQRQQVAGPLAPPPTPFTPHNPATDDIACSPLVVAATPSTHADTPTDAADAATQVTPYTGELSFAGQAALGRASASPATPVTTATAGAPLHALVLPLRTPMAGDGGATPALFGAAPGPRARQAPAGGLRGPWPVSGGGMAEATARAEASDPATIQQTDGATDASQSEAPAQGAVDAAVNTDALSDVAALNAWASQSVTLLAELRQAQVERLRRSVAGPNLVWSSKGPEWEDVSELLGKAAAAAAHLPLPTTPLPLAASHTSNPAISTDAMTPTLMFAPPGSAGATATFGSLVRFGSPVLDDVLFGSNQGADSTVVVTTSGVQQSSGAAVSSNGLRRAVPPPPPPPPPPAAAARSGVSAATLPRRPGAPPPPPPPPPRSSGGRATPTRGQTRLLKALHWDKLARVDKGTIWDAIQAYNRDLALPPLDAAQLEALFGLAASQPGRAGAAVAAAAGASGPGSVRLIAPQKSHNLSIVLSGIKIPWPTLRRSFTRLTMPEPELAPEQLSALLKWGVPSQDEADAIRAYLQGSHPQYPGQRDILSLGVAERFMARVTMRVPRVAVRLTALSFMTRLAPSVKDVQALVQLIVGPSEAVRSSEALRLLLAHVLAVGNHMNAGTARGNAQGFQLSILLRLADIKSTQFPPVGPAATATSGAPTPTSLPAHTPASTATHMTPQSHNTPASTSQLAASPTLSTMSTAASTATTATAVSTAVTAITAAANAAGLGRVGGVVGQADKTSLLRFVVRSLWQHSQAIAELPEQLNGLKAAASVQVSCISSLIAELQAGYQLLGAEAATAASLLTALQQQPARSNRSQHTLSSHGHSATPSSGAHTATPTSQASTQGGPQPGSPVTVGASSDGLATGLPGQSGTAKGAAVARTTKRSKQDIVECGVGEESEAGGVIGEVKAEETESSLLAFLGELQRFMQAHEAMVGGLGDLETKLYEELRSLAAYFGEEYDSKEPTKILTIVHRFLHDFNKELRIVQADAAAAERAAALTTTTTTSTSAAQHNPTTSTAGAAAVASASQGASMAAASVRQEQGDDLSRTPNSRDVQQSVGIVPVDGGAEHNVGQPAPRRAGVVVSNDPDATPTSRLSTAE